MHVLRIPTFVCFSMYAMHASQVGQHFNLHPNFELWKRRHYPIIPTGMRSNIKGRWQPRHQCESFHWSIILYLHCVSKYSRSDLLYLVYLSLYQWTKNKTRKAGSAWWPQSRNRSSLSQTGPYLAKLTRKTTRALFTSRRRSFFVIIWQYRWFRC